MSPVAISEDQLRELLTERSDPARRHPVPEERIAVRIRRARRRRAAGAGVLAVAAVAGALSGLVLAHQPAPGHAASYSAPPLPTSFTASDGTVYRRLAITPVTGPNQRSASLTISVGSGPVDIMATCDHRKGTTFVIATANSGGSSAFANCQGPGRLAGLPVHPGKRVRIKIEAGSPIGSRIAGWQFAAYAWTPPAIAAPAPAKPRLPQSYTGPAYPPSRGKAQWRLVTSRSGDWPADQTVTIKAPAGTSTLKLVMVCRGAIAGRSWVTTSGYKSQEDIVGFCLPWTPGQQVPGQVTITRRDGKPYAITLHVRAPQPNSAAYATRTSSWAIALYAEQR